jgi:hypothetical protein
MIYAGASTTATVSNGTQISEADENSDHQAHFVAAKFGQSGTVTITWALAASRQWACYAVAFEETGGGAETITLDKWHNASGGLLTRRILGMVPSGTIGIKG